MRQDFVAKGRVRFLPPEEGGRRSGPPSGPRYSATAVFVLGDDSDVILNWPAGAEHFSIVLHLSDAQEGGEIQVDIGFLAPELVADKLTVGTRLLVMEGPRPVGELEVTSIEGHEALT